MLTYNQDIYQKQNSSQKKYLHSLIQKGLAYSTGINISSAIAQTELGRGYKKILNDIFTIVDGYSVGNKCRTWQLKADKVINLSTKDERAAKNNATFITFDKSVDKILEGYSHHEKICAISHMNKCYSAKCHSDLVYNIDDTLGGRETNALSCLPSKIRALAIINGNKAVSMDIKSSQPRTTIKVLKIDEYKNNDAVYFTKLVNTGKIYEHLSNNLYMTREEAKIAYNASINSDCSTNSFVPFTDNKKEYIKNKRKAENKAAVSKFIKERFPTVYNIIKEYSKINGKKSIGRACMTLEANAVNEICKKYNNVIPVYDQIYVFGGDIQKIQNDFVDSIKKNMGWTQEETISVKNHNEFLHEEEDREEKEEEAIILVSKPKSIKMLRYLQARIIKKWFDFGQKPIRI